MFLPKGSVTGKGGTDLKATSIYPFSFSPCSHGEEEKEEEATEG